MTNELTDRATAPDVRPALVADLTALVDSEVQGMSGFSGMAAKAAYAAATRRSPTAVRRNLDAQLPRLTDALAPHWDAWRTSGEGTFGDYLAARDEQVAGELMALADEAAPSKADAAMAAVRPQARKVLVAAMPRLGAVLQRHAG